MKNCHNKHEKIWFYGDTCPLCEAYKEIDQLKDQACASIISIDSYRKQIDTLRGVYQNLLDRLNDQRLEREFSDR